ncbi:histidine kinase dimerization/phosphoacceptor domain -containing protein [Larkinella arboricola]
MKIKVLINLAFFYFAYGCWLPLMISFPFTPSRFWLSLALWSTLSGFSVWGQNVPLSTAEKTSQPSPYVQEYEKLREAQQLYREAVAKHDSTLLSEACYLLSKRYKTLGDLVTSEKWAIQSLRIREGAGPSNELGKLYIQLSGNCMASSRYQEAYVYAHRALTTFQAIRSERGLMGAYSMLAGVHSLDTASKITLKNKSFFLSLDSTFYYHKLAEQIALKQNDLKELSMIYVAVAAAWQQRDIKRSIPYLKSALAFFTTNKVYHSVVGVQIALANAYRATGQIQRAGRLLAQAKHTFYRHNLAHYYLLGDLETAYARLYQQTGRSNQAILHLEKAHEIQTKALKQDRDGAISRLGLVYGIEQKEAQLKKQQHQIALSKEKLRSQRQISVAAFLLATLTAMMCSVFFYYNRKNQRISRQNAELVKEQNHRVKNNLQVISSLLSLQAKRLSDPGARLAVEESQLRVQAIAMLHRQLYNGNKLIEVDVTAFIPDIVNGVFQVYGFDPRIAQYTLSPFWLHVDKAVPLGLIINELTTNACKYAFTDHPNASLTITCYQKDAVVCLQVADNGPGFTHLS